MLSRFSRASLLLLLGGCKGGGSHTVAASSYPRTCASSGECVAIFEGTITCSNPLCQCPNAAIRDEAYASYASDLEKRAPACDPDMKCGFGALKCSGGVLTCPNGLCEYHPWALENPDAANPRAVSAADYGRACTSVADCAPVYEGPLGCCDQGCPNAAIRQDAVDAYMKDVGARAPVCVPVPPCIPPAVCTSGRADCRDGVCALIFPPPDGAAID